MNRIVAVKYTSDTGVVFRTGLNEEVFDALDGAGPATLVGGSVAPANEALDPLPRQMKPRRAVVCTAEGKTREIICLSPNAPLLTMGKIINLEDSDGLSEEYKTIGAKSQSFRKRKQQAI